MDNFQPEQDQLKALICELELVTKIYNKSYFERDEDAVELRHVKEYLANRVMAIQNIVSRGVQGERARTFYNDLRGTAVQIESGRSVLPQEADEYDQVSGARLGPLRAADYAARLDRQERNIQLAHDF